jgi:hypothetical protein
LSGRLEDVWIGTFKLKVNLSLFGRNRKSDPSLQRRSGEEWEKKGFSNAANHGSRGSNVSVSVDKPFKSALMGSLNVAGNKALPTMEVEAAIEMMEVLQGSLVGRLVKGVELRALQVKLWLARLHSVRVASMGGGLVLLFRNSGENVGEPVSNKDWWGGLLSEVKIWSPNLVAKSREVWVSLYGIPPHAWGENTFRKLANSCGVSLELEMESRNNVRLDLARVKIEAPLCGRIDFVVTLIIQGAKFVVRVVKEGGGVFRDDDHIEDQLRRSEVGSSCASGGKGSVRAVLDGIDDDVSDSDGSENCQQISQKKVEVVGRSKGYKQGVGAISNKSDDVPGEVMPIPSMGKNIMGIDDNRILADTCGVRGFDFGGQVENYKHVEETEVQVFPLVGNGPGRAELAIGPLELSGAGGVEVGCLVEQDSSLGLESNILIPTQPISASGILSPKKKLIDNFDHMLVETRGKAGVVSSSNLYEGSLSPSVEILQPQNKRGKVSRVPTTFPPLFGPKCLRFAGIINNSALIRKCRRLLDSMGSSFYSHLISSEEANSTTILKDNQCCEVGEAYQQCEV